MNLEERKDLANILFPNIKNTREYYEKKYPNRNLPEGAMVTRFGPSPTGFVHMGSLFSSFVDSTYAKQSGGVFFLRIEDTDQKRMVENGIDGIFNDLESFDIVPDESSKNGGEYGPYIQSERTEIYQTYVKDLIIQGYAYPCFMKEEEIESIKEEQKVAKTKVGIYGMYAQDRDLTLDEIKKQLDNNDEYVIRLKSPRNPENIIKFHDEIKGDISFPEYDMDMVLLKKDGTPTYHLAHAIDDHLMHTTHVIRGDEWVSSIPLHVQLFKILGFDLPKYCHTAPITKKDEETGNIRKLSKRLDPEAAVSYYHEMGIPIPAVKLYLATILNSNFEEWYLNNSDKKIDDFTFTFDRRDFLPSFFVFNRSIIPENSEFSSIRDNNSIIFVSSVLFLSQSPCSLVSLSPELGIPSPSWYILLSLVEKVPILSVADFAWFELNATYIYPGMSSNDDVMYSP